MNLSRLTHLLVALVLACLSAPVLTQAEPITAKESDSAVRSIAEAIGKEYFDAGRAAEISAGLLASLKNGDFAAVDDAHDLASVLTVRLSEEDRHFRVNYVGMDVIKEIEASMLAERGAGEGSPTV